MKKIFLTVLTAALISGGAFAQEQDSIQNNSQTGDSTMIRKDAEQAENQAEDSLERTKDQMQQETKEAGDALEQGANKTGDAIEQGAEKTGDAIQEGANKTEDAMSKDNDTKTSGEASGTSTSDEGTAVTEQRSYGPKVEVVSGKEGPNHEVVYKVNDEMFYVDRQEKQLVKAEESNLKDAKDEAVVHSAEKK